MDFSLTTMFVIPANSFFPAAGSTEDLVAGQFGIFGPDYSVANAANIATMKYVTFAQGRKENIPDVGSKRSDKIAKQKVVSWYKVKADPNAGNQSTTIGGFTLKCDEQITVTIRAHSNYIDAGFSNGYTQSVTVDTPCCNCGESPCTQLSGNDIQDIVDNIIAKFTISGPFMGSVLSNYFEMHRVGAAEFSQLVITGKPLTSDGRIADLSANPWEYDRLWYDVFIFNGADTTQDYLTYDRCEQVATISKTGSAGFVRGSSDEIFHMEKYYYSYQSPALKTLMDKPGYNGAFESLVVDGTFYDTYYLKFLPLDDTGAWGSTERQDESVILAIPTGNQGLVNLLSAYFGNPEDYSADPHVIAGP